MWGNLSNVRSMAEKLGNVVAPPPGEGEEYYSEEDEGEYEDDEDDYEEEEEYEADSSGPSSPFGLVSMLAQAMDSGQKLREQEDIDPSEQSHEQKEGVHFDDEPPNSEFKVHEPSFGKMEALEEASNILVQPAQLPIEHNNPSTLQNDSPSPTNCKEPSGDPSSPRSGSTPAFPMQPIDEKLQQPQQQIVDHETPPKHHHPRKMALVRESGSLSPQRNCPKFGIGDTGGFPSVRPLGSTSSGEQVTLSPLREALAGVPAEQSLPEVVKLDDPSDSKAINKASNDPRYDENTISAAPEATSASNGVEASKSYRASNGSVAVAAETTTEDQRRMEKLEKRCKELKRQLDAANQQVVQSRSNPETEVVAHPSSTVDEDTLLQKLQENEARLLQATTAEHEEALQALQRSADEKMTEMQRQLEMERTSFDSERSQVHAMLSEATTRAEELQVQLQQERNQNDRTASQLEQNQMRALRLTEDKLAQAYAAVDDREETIGQLKKKAKALESRMTEDRAGAQEADEEIDELHNENEVLHGQVEKLQAERDSLRNQVAQFEGESDQLIHLKMELRMLKEDRDRATAKVEDMTASAQNNSSQMAQERDDALAAANDLQLQLSAALADITVAKADAEHVTMSNENLQAALEAFQSERETEMALLEEHHQNQETALEAANRASIAALKEVQLSEMKQVQEAADKAVTNSMEEIRRLEEKVEMIRKENIQTRRALDEAISRLQTTQDDVVDRTFMKNILLDWLTKSEKKERAQVLQVMADMLHFTEDEKRNVNIDAQSGSVRNLMAPPPSKVDLSNLEGENVREKWVNFLISEAD